MNDRRIRLQDWLGLVRGRSRAIAFHLGCLRALNRSGLLDKVVVLSTVSGGSVIGAYYQAHQGDFAAFEAKIREILARGLARPMLQKLFSPLGLRVAVAFVAIGLVAVGIGFIRLLAKVAVALAPARLADKFEEIDLRSPLHRFASRTTLLEAALDDLLFHKARLTDLPRGLIWSSMRPNCAPHRRFASAPMNPVPGAGETPPKRSDHRPCRNSVGRLPAFSSGAG